MDMINLFPLYPDYWVELGRMFIIKKKHEAFFSCLRIALSIDYTRIDIWEKLIPHYPRFLTNFGIASRQSIQNQLDQLELRCDPARKHRMQETIQGILYPPVSKTKEEDLRNSPELSRSLEPIFETFNGQV